jgi:hypothetical protein
MDTPSYWVLNPLNENFNSIPKKRKGLVKIRDPVCMEEEDVILSELAWIPRRISYLPKLIEKLKSRLSFTTNNHK